VAKCLYQAHFLFFIMSVSTAWCFIGLNRFYIDYSHFSVKFIFSIDQPVIRHILNYFLHIPLFIINIKWGGGIKYTVWAEIGTVEY
jgi:hypothetical protein